MKKTIIQFKDFSFKYRSQVEPTLVNINLTIYEGEKVLIVGPSGSGKSTIAHCINGLIPFSYKGDIEGSLIIKEKETKDLDLFSLSKIVGTVLQDPDGQFIGLSVGEDIAFALENDCVPQEKMKKQVVNVSKLVEMEAHIDTSIHELSGGQKQRVSLGGVLVDQAAILLFDEPLANLDPATGQLAITLIDQVQKETDTTVVIIEHRLEDVLHESVDRIIVMDEGRIVSDTTPDALLVSNVLESSYIREPLYIKALKYANIRLTEEMRPAHLTTLDIDGCKANIQEWFESAELAMSREKTTPVIAVRNLNFGYNREKQILHDVSFSIKQGEMVSIVGRNGTGKSTLSRLICGFEKAQSGEILYQGEDITNDTIRQRAERIGMVMQNPNHMISKHMIYDEVSLGLIMRGVPEEEVKSRVEKTLKVCGLYPFRNWPISALSFGQKKRVTIASILVLNPKILILDEPTAGQDFRHYTEIMEFLLELNQQGVTILMITHDMHLMLEYTPRAIAIANGRILADDSAVNILTNEEVIEQANLKQTSLFDLAVRADIVDPKEFVSRFIAFDKEVRKKWQ
ncbi:ABC transporter ATP-binding protein [Oceanobacillus chungangensis]|uniref:Heme ABC transporter ATP-binding protein n=1 Tax=Oceanobacillus chungangensis TaxID=1229152 RepID=A0A3D8PJ05_9BACI|nr:ABC transporter ATP-binding protein [Oceanobacillus chungangensis]RDW15457.1 heme ABC transporter ATP-binding protein [Oceanobacillus chungangensis]